MGRLRKFHWARLLRHRLEKGIGRMYRLETPPFTVRVSNLGCNRFLGTHDIWQLTEMLRFYYTKYARHSEAGTLLTVLVSPRPLREGSSHCI